MYRLQEQDLNYLYPYYYPSQIKKEFGDASPTPRWIQMHYKKIGVPPVDQYTEEVITGSYAIADMNIPSEQWLELFMDELVRISIERKEKVMQRLHEHY